MALFFLCGSLKAQLKADFSVNINAACTPLFASFQDLSTGNPTQWQWDLGDGTSTKQNPGNIYLTPGVYNITLTVKNATETSTVTKTAYITVYAKPDVQFSVLPPAEGCAPLPVQFTDQTTPGSGTIKEEIWDFGDGQIFIGTNPVHTYTASDTFDVILTVENSFGCKQTLQKPKVVNVYNNVDANFDYTYTNACKPPTNVTFKNLSTSKSTVTYSWIFGDGATSTQQDPVHVYNTAGTYNVQLIATTDLGCTDTIVKSLSIGSAAADFILPADACANKLLSFINSSTLQPVSVNWSFGDGATANTIDATHTYTNPGSYKVIMTADFGGCTSSITKTLIIAAKPQIDFGASGTLATCNFPATIQFTNATTGAVSYMWYFGDSTSSTEVSPSHTYDTAGFYTVTLVAVNSNGCSDTLIKPGYIKLGPPKIDSVKNLPIRGCVPQTITPVAVINSGEPVTSYLWDFGDGNTSTEATPTYTYNVAGTYKVSLIVKTASGCADTFSLRGAVSVGNKPAADFTADPLEGCATKMINFTDQSTGDITGWLWDFGDGTTSIAQSPTHEYRDTGYFAVTLTVESNGCMSTITKPNYIHISPPIAQFDITLKCNENYKRSFTNTSIGAKTWMWDFGDGTSDKKPNPSHVYADTGLYFVQLTVTNGVCADVYIDTVNIIDQNPLFTVLPSDPQICKYDSVTFNATNYNVSSIAGFYWNFGDSTFLGFNIKNTTVDHTYRQSGDYSPFMVVRYVNNCKDTVSFAPLKIKVYGPTPAFSNPEGTCINGTIPFTDSSVTDGVHPITQWIWDYGDGSAPVSYTAPPFQHTYASTDSFDVKLVLFDSYGCKDSLVKKNAVIITKPVANFTVLDSLRCTTSAVNFVDSSKGLALSYNWSFGDGTSSAQANPMHLYPAQNTYSVKLVITDKFGCTDSIQKDNYITISNPKASFILNDTFGVCPPLLIQPQNTSQNYQSVFWDFKDGNTSNEISPQHFYNTAGTYLLTLIAKGYGTCYDTATQKVLLKGPSGTFTYSDTQACSPAKITFNATTKNTENLIWGYGDGETETTKNTTVEYTYTDYGKYLPKLILIDSSGCKVGLSNSSDTITISDVAANFKFTPQEGCDSALITFTDSSVAYFDTISLYQWNFGDGTTSAATNPSHYYNNSGSYPVSLTVNTATGCKDTFTISAAAKVNMSPQITLNVPDSSCVATPVNFKADNVINDTSIQWQWNFGNGSIDANQNPVFTYPSAGLFNINVSAVNQFGCKDTATHQINVLPPPPLNAGLDTFLCSGNSVPLQATGAAGYLWTFDASSLSCVSCANPTAQPDTSTLYYVQGTSSFGCEAVDSVFVEVKQPVTLSLDQKDTLCLGQSIQLFASGAEVYNWQPPTGLSNPFIANPIASPTTTTTYTLKGSDDKNCFSDTKSITVNVYPIPAFNIIDSVITLNLGSTDTLQTTSSPDVIRWQWSPSTWLNCIDCPQPVTSPKGEIIYIAKAFNEAGCSATDQVTIRMLCNGANIFVPNTFSPNNDGMNDQFFPRGNGDFSIRSFRIFNRWGEIVFDKTNIKPNISGDGWNGTFKNNDMPEGVYVYVMELVCDKNAIYQLKGNVTLIR